MRVRFCCANRAFIPMAVYDATQQKLPMVISPTVGKVWDLSAVPDLVLVAAEVTRLQSMSWIVDAIRV